MEKATIIKKKIRAPEKYFDFLKVFLPLRAALSIPAVAVYQPLPQVRLPLNRSRQCAAF